MTVQKQTVTAREVREFYRADEKRMARLSEAAQATVREGARGKVHPEVIADHNKSRRTKVYSVGATTEAVAAEKAERLALRVSAFEAGYSVGARGPLPKEFLAQSKG